MRAIARACNIAELRRLARRRLPRPIFDYIDGGADDEAALANNAGAFGRYQIVPDTLVGKNGLPSATGDASVSP